MKTRYVLGMRIAGAAMALTASPLLVQQFSGQTAGRAPAPVVLGASPFQPIGVKTGKSGPETGDHVPAPTAYPRRNDAPVARRNADCKVPRPSDSARLVLFGAYEGTGMSDFAAAGPDVETSAVRVNSVRSDRPTYALLTGYESLVWIFGGDASAIEHVVVRKGSAVSGLPASKVTVLEDDACLPYFYEKGGADQIKASRSLIDLVGRSPDVVEGTYAVSVVELPSGSYGKDERRGPPAAPPGFDVYSYTIASHYAPSGVVHVDPGATRSGPKGVPYDVLPQGFGLAQLTGQGSLRRMSGHNEYRIEKSIPRFPAGLNGGHSAKFILARGVPMPAGSPGHSCVISEETGESLGSSAIACR